MRLRRGEQVLESVCVGDGPVDASLLAVEQIVGRHYELDDFQIQAVTEGREAMSLPQLDEQFALRALTELVRLDADWVPHGLGTSLYIRPFLLGDDEHLGVHAINHVGQGMPRVDMRKIVERALAGRNVQSAITTATQG